MTLSNPFFSTQHHHTDICKKELACPFHQGCGSGGSGPFSVEAEAQKFYRFRFHMGYLT